MPNCVLCGCHYKSSIYNKTNKCDDCSGFDGTYGTPGVSYSSSSKYKTKKDKNYRDNYDEPGAYPEHRDVDIDLILNPTGKTKAVFYDEEPDSV